MGFIVIFWKNWILRKRHWLFSLFEIILPIFLFIMCTYVIMQNEALQKKYINSTTYNKILSTNDIFEKLPYFDTKIYYTPNNQFIRNLIENVRLKLKIVIDDTRGFKNESELLQFVENQDNQIILGIVFRIKKKLKILDYDIRIDSKGLIWNTNKQYLSESRYIPGRGSGVYLENGFLPLQLAIDIAYSELLNITIPEITFQEFPYPPHWNDEATIELLSNILPMVTVLGFVLMFPGLLLYIVEEKECGIQHLMKVMGGINSWLWIGWFFYALPVNVISITIIVIMLKVNLVTDTSIIEYCDGKILYIFLLLYCCSAISLCFFFSTIIKNPHVSTISGILYWVLTFSIPFITLKKYPTNFLTNILLCLNPNIALLFGYKTIFGFESRAVYLNFVNINEKATDDDVTMLTILIFFICEIILLLSLTIYFDDFNFTLVCKKIKSFYTIKRRQLTINKDETIPLEDRSNTNTSIITIKSLKIVFDKETVLNNVNMEIYKNKITALLGVNGAGKSVLFSLLSGKKYVYEGEVTISNDNKKYDLRKNFNKLCGKIGICRQKNVLYYRYTVYEHFFLFALIKNLSVKEAKEEAIKFLKLLNLEKERNLTPQKLSGGMKRKVCVGMALIGEPKILLLDEPTFGVDIASRHKIWQCLQSKKNKTTILFTTNIMKEAEMFSDYVAFLDEGKISKFAEFVTLNKNYELGYYVKLMFYTLKAINDFEQSENMSESLNDPTNKFRIRISFCDDKYMRKLFELAKKIEFINLESKITGRIEFKKKLFKNEIGFGDLQIIFKTEKDFQQYTSQYNIIFYKTKIVDEEELFSEQFWDMGYNLNLIFESNNIMKKFIQLETKCSDFFYCKKVYEIQTCISLDKSYKFTNIIRLEKNIDVDIEYVRKGIECVFKEIHNRENAETDKCSIKTVDLLKYPSLRRQIRTLVQKRLQFMGSTLSVLIVLFMTSLLGILLITFLSTLGNISQSETNVQLLLNLNIYPNSIVYYHASDNYKNNYATIVSSQNGNPMITKHLNEEMLENSQGNITFYKKNVTVGAIFNNSENKVNVMYSNYALHGAPISLNIVMNTILEGHKIIVRNTPLNNLNERLIDEKSETYNAAIWLFIFPLSMYICFCTRITFPHYENIYNVKELQIMTGLRSGTYWLTCYLTDLIIVIIINILLTLIIIKMCGSYMEEYSNLKEMGVLAAIIFITALAFIPYVYLFFSNFRSSIAGTTTFFLNNFLIGLSWTILQLYFENNTFFDIFQYLTIDRIPIFHPAAFAYVIVYFSRKATWKYNWSIKSAAQKSVYCRRNPNPCCINDSVEECEDFKSYSKLKIYFLIMFAYTVLFLVFIIVRDTQICKFVANVSICKRRRRNRRNTYELSSVTSPKMPLINDTDVFSAHHLKRKFKNWGGIDDLDFHLKSGQCIGILGGNGAGKSTTFKILTGKIKGFTGLSCINIKRNKIFTLPQRMYFRQIGYCPQIDSLNMKLTAKALLETFGRLRGLLEADLKKEVDQILKLLSLEKHSEENIMYYSGGMKRKLSLSLALIGHPPIIILDEPTAGIDVLSTEIIIKTLKKYKSDGGCIIITLHDLDFCKAICDNVIVLRRGKTFYQETLQKLLELEISGSFILYSHLNSLTYMMKFLTKLKSFEDIQIEEKASFIVLHTTKSYELLTEIIYEKLPRESNFIKRLTLKNIYLLSLCNKISIDYLNKLDSIMDGMEFEN